MVGLGRSWSAVVGHGRSWSIKVDHGRLRSIPVGRGRFLLVVNNYSSVLRNFPVIFASATCNHFATVAIASTENAAKLLTVVLTGTFLSC